MRTDSAIYWQRTGVGDDGRPQFLLPVVIKCRWDNWQKDHEVSEATENVRNSSTVYPDRILVTGSFLMYGGDVVLNTLTDKEKANPKLLSDAVMVKTQKITAKWRVKNVQWKPNDQSDDIFIEVTV
jgi:hypothetical protein